MASFRKRSGRWQARIAIKGMSPIVRTFDVRVDAEKWARAVQREIDLGVYLPRSGIELLPLSGLIDVYRQKVVPTLRGASTELIRLETISKEIGSTILGRLSPPDIAKFRDVRLHAVSPSTVLRELQTLSALLNYARKEMHLPIQNPVQAIRKPIANKGRERRLHAGEEAALLAAMTYEGRKASGQLGAGTRNQWIKPLVMIALETAMRRGELLALKWEHVDVRRQTAYLPITKNGLARTVPLSRAAVRIFDALPRSIDGRVFPLSANALKHAWNRACLKAEIVDLHFHDLRHEAASRLAERLPNVIELAAVTGHRDLRMLHRYVHVKAEELAQKLN